MKNLILIRHAKSDWELHQDDFERGLASRGINDAKRVASHVVNFLPERYIIVSSSAVRARETSILFAQAFSYPLERIQLSDSLYTFDDLRLEHEIRAFPDDYQNIILFGHNEAITNFVNKFGDMKIDNVSTAGFVSLVFDTESWRKITKGKTEKVLFPRDLKS